MANSPAATVEDRPRTRTRDPGGSGHGPIGARNSVVSWGAIAAGAAAAVSLSMVLMLFGVGLGLSSVSPWAWAGVSAPMFGLMTILWLLLTQLLASGLGGYLAGRLRALWTDARADEVRFQDAAHGFLAWAVAALATAIWLTVIVGAIVSAGAQAGASMVGGVVGAASVVTGSAPLAGAAPQGLSAPMGYFVDALFRNDDARPDQPRASESDMAEVSRIFLRLDQSEALSPQDMERVSQIVAQRTGLSPQAAQTRVADVHARSQTELRAATTAAREATDKALESSTYAALWLFASLLAGALISSHAATVGGRRRDA